MVRTATVRSSPLLTSGPQTSQVGRSTRAQENNIARGNADDLSFNTTLISKSPDLVLSHLQARRMGEDSMQAVQRIGGTAWLHHPSVLPVILLQYKP